MYDILSEAIMDRVSCVVNSCAALEHALAMAGLRCVRGVVRPLALPYKVVIMSNVCSVAIIGPTAFLQV